MRRINAIDLISACRDSRREKVEDCNDQETETPHHWLRFRGSSKSEECGVTVKHNRKNKGRIDLMTETNDYIRAPQQFSEAGLLREARQHRYGT